MKVNVIWDLEQDEKKENKQPSKCKECGSTYYDSGEICPSCTEHYNSVYNRTNLVGFKKSKVVKQSRNTILMFSSTIGSGAGLILILGMLQAYLPLVWSFYYIIVGLCIGKLVGKYGARYPMFSIVYSIALTVMIFYLADVVSIGLVNNIIWARMNDYVPSIWNMAINVWRFSANGAGVLTIIFKSIGLYEAWKYSQVGR